MHSLFSVGTYRIERSENRTEKLIMCLIRCNAQWPGGSFPEQKKDPSSEKAESSETPIGVI